MTNPLPRLVAKWSDYQPMILSYLRKHVKDEAIAQDISQDMFLKVYRLSQQPHYTVTNIRSWLFQIAHNA